MLNQKDILKCREGDVIKYNDKVSGFNYLVVEEITSDGEK